MYFCIALLLNHNIQNKIRKLVCEINERYNIGITASLLPQHITVKDTFEYNDAGVITDYLQSIKQNIKPLEIEFGKPELIELPDKNGVIWWNVMINDGLQKLHCKIVDELKQNYSINSGNYDGEKFCFHSTIFFGGLSIQEYRILFTELKNNLINCKTVSNEIALFCSHEKTPVPGSFYVYYIEQLNY